MNSVMAFLIVLGILIFVHELGHFLVARWCGVGVKVFSLGFGPRVAGWTAGRTDYRLSAVPLGGYVRMVGEDPDEEMDPADIPVSFSHKSLRQRALIVAAGPVSNLLLAVLIFLVLFLISGAYILKPVVGQVESGSPADIGGLQPGDSVAGVNHEPVETWEDMARLIGAGKGQTLLLHVEREGQIFDLELTPEIKITQNIFGEDVERWVIGIISAGEYVHQRLNPLQAAAESLRQCYKIVELTVVSIAKLIRGTLSSKTLGGPIMIAEMAGQQARQGALNLIFFIALLSINLAILNLLPIPVLDGGHLLFFAIEGITGRPINLKVREIAHRAGIFALMMLMALVFYNDITRLFFGEGS